MTPYYADDWLQVYGGDCRAVMAELPAESVHCVVTSPPYWGLRDYGQADQLGLEPTPEEYVANMVAVFREVRRVLRNDGTVWLNLGDSYSGGGSGPQGESGEMLHRQVTRNRNLEHKRDRLAGLKPKDLVGIPWRVAFALQADGWYLRSDIIWSKPNPMPESVTDRPTKSHEYLFLLSKSPKYYWDADAVREGVSENTHSRGKGIGVKNAGIEFGQGIKNNEDFASAINGPVSARNIRSVWTIATQPYPGAHFATFPRKLVEPCVKAGTSERGVCPECGAPWVRVVERTPTDMAARYERGEPTRHGTAGAAASSASNVGGFSGRSETTAWRPSCAHTHKAGADSHVPDVSRSLAPAPAPVPATVLDPFAGSGTTGAVAQALGRRAILIDLNPDYLAQAMGRNRDIPLGLAG